MQRTSLTPELECILFQIPLFRDLPSNIKSTILARLDHQCYTLNKGDVFARQGTPCKSLYVILQGKLRADIIDGAGSHVLVEHINAPRAFATPHLFNAKDDRLPVTFTACEDCIFFIATKESTFRLISEEPTLLKSFLCITGNCNVCTTSRLNVLSFKNVRSRFVAYLFEHKKGDNRAVRLIHNQTQLAEYINVARPALSKEINKMVKEGLIRVEKEVVYLLKDDNPENYQ